MMTAIEHAFGNLMPLLQEYGVAAVAIILMLESRPGATCHFRPFSFWRGPAPSSATISAM